MSTGTQRIQAERDRQILSEGWSAENDDQYTGRQLMLAAHCYASGSTQHWPWDKTWWKPSGDVCRNYEKAGALYLAEHDRLIRGGYWNKRLDGDLPELMKLKAEEMANRIDEISHPYIQHCEPSGVEDQG